MQNERGTQHGTSRRTPLPLFRAVSIFCLSVAIFSTSLPVGFGRSQPPCARVIRQDGGRRQAAPPTTGLGGLAFDAPLTSVTRRHPPAAARRASPPPAPSSRSTTRTRWRPDRPASRGHPPRAHRDAAPP